MILGKSIKNGRKLSFEKSDNIILCIECRTPNFYILTSSVYFNESHVLLFQL